MDFPISLYKNGRKTIPTNLISTKDLIFARHSSSNGYTGKLPNFASIKHDQSFNWSAFSIPSWVRFGTLEEYKKDSHGIAGYSIGIFLDPEPGSHNDARFNLVHDPIEINYSHVTIQNNSINNLHINLFKKIIRRQIEIAHLSKYDCLPKNEYSNEFIKTHYLLMRKCRLRLCFSMFMDNMSTFVKNIFQRFKTSQ